MARIYGDRGNYGKSVEHLQKGLQLSPTNIAALYELGRLLFEAKNYSEAVNVLKRLTSLDPKYPKAQKMLTQAQKRIKSGTNGHS